MVKELTCIVCPRGCQLKVEIDENNQVLDVQGHTCPRGKTYAIDECTHPVRTITSTVRTTTGEVVAVKTNGNVPKETIFDCMREINRATVTLPVHIGDVVISNILNTGVDLVITANME